MKLGKLKNIETHKTDLGSVAIRKLSELDEHEVFEKLKDRFVWELWEDQLVNGKTKEELRTEGVPFPETKGIHYLIKDSESGKALYVQSFDYELSGYQAMNEARAKELAIKQCEELTQRAAHFFISNYLTKELKNVRD